MVDDEPLFRQAVARRLTCKGFEVHEAATLDHALSLCEVLIPGILITDYNLCGAGSTGFDLADQVRSSMAELAPRVIVVSGSSVLPKERSGVDLMMLKAFDDHGLVEAVQELCGESQELGAMSSPRKKARISTDRMKAMHHDFQGTVSSIDRRARRNK